MQFGDFEALFRDIITCSMDEDEETDYLLTCISIPMFIGEMYKKCVLCPVCFITFRAFV